MGWIALLLLALGAQDARALPYETMALDTGGHADEILSEDLDGDSLPDLIIQNGRDIHVFLAQPPGRFTPRPQQILRLDGSVFLWMLAPLQGKDAPLSLLAAGSRAIQAHAFDGAGFEPKGTDLVVHPSLFQAVSPGAYPPLRLDFAPDLDGDGRSEVLLFEDASLFVMKAPPGGDFRCLQKIPLDPATSWSFTGGSSLRVIRSLEVPLLAFGDLDGDGRADICSCRDEILTVFPQAEGGRFGPPRSLPLDAERRKRSERFIRFELPPRLQDFNRDGILDAALVRPGKGRVQVHYGAPGRRDFTQPEDVMQVSNAWTVGVYFEDLDGDARPELIMGVVRKFGITEGIQVFLSGRVDMNLLAFPMNAEGRFSKDPVQDVTFSIPFTFHVTRTSAMLDLIFRPGFRGDFDKDGRRDLLVASDARTLHVYRGSREHAFEDAPFARISMDPPDGTAHTESFAADFNRDGVSDLILKHVSPGNDKHTLELKLSQP